MIIYNVTVKVDRDVHEEWLVWMKGAHIPDVIATGYFTDYRISRLLGQDDSDGFTYAIQYYCDTLEDLEAYTEQHSPRLQEEHQNRFKDKFVAFRTIMESV